LRLIRFLYCDNGGIIRGKATHASKLATRMREGIGQSLAMQAFTGVETPTSLDEALDELEHDQVLLDALGPLLAASYIAVKRDEAAFFTDKSPEEEARQHFYKY
jgi:glutamine synthetase